MLDAVIFDMDGVLIDSEPLWQDAEIEVFATVGLVLDRDLCTQTMGLRLDEAVAHWYLRHPWTTPSQGDIAAAILRRVTELILERGEALPGIEHALGVVTSAGLRVALASSSPRLLIDAVLARLGLTDTFEVVHSAQDEAYGKPHPAIYLTTAERLGVDPARCLAIEDSLNGVIAAKAAGMRCVAIPERDDRQFAIADVVLPSLRDLTLP